MSDSPSPPKNPQPPATGIIAGIMVALFAWGGYLAIGGYYAALQQKTATPLFRSLAIFGCTVIFLAFWGVMLLVRRNRAPRRDQRE